MSTFNLPFSIFIADRKPVDDRYVVSNETERLSIGNGIRAFNGLQIFQQDTKKLYILNDYATSDWIEVGSGAIVKGDLISINNKISISGGTESILGSGVAIEIVESNISINNLNGVLSVNKGGTGISGITGIIKGDGINPFINAIENIDYISPSGIATLSNKTLIDNTTYFQDNIDNTKRIQFQLSGVSTNTTRIYNMPNLDGTIALLSDLNSYQPLNSNLSSISSLSFSTTSFVKMTGVNTFTLDTNTYEPTLTKGNISATTPITLSATRQVIGGSLSISINDASVTAKGAVQLSNSYSGTSQVLAVTEKALSDGLATKQNVGVVSSHASSHISGGGTDVIPNFTSVNSGLVPPSGGGTTNFLRADGSWFAPSFTGAYLPLSGGTLTGDLTINKSNPKLTLYGGSDDNEIIEFWDDSTLRCYIQSDGADGSLKIVGNNRIALGFNSGEKMNIDNVGNTTITGIFKSTNVETNVVTYTTRVGLESGYNENISTNRDNVFIGYRSGYSTTTGYKNIYIGRQAGYTNIYGFSNVFIGNYSGRVTVGSSSSNLGNWNTFIGDNSGFNNTTGTGGVYLGALSGYDNTTGSGNTFIGYATGNENTTGYHNVSVGAFSGNGNGDSNTNIGTYSGADNMYGSHNTLIGNYSGHNGETCSYTVAVGSFSGYANINGNSNVFIGYQSGYNNIGSNNVFIGYQSGYNETGSNRLYIDNSNTPTPLIYGDFNLNELTINGKFTVTRDIIANSGMTVAGSLSSGNIKFLGENGYTKTTEGLIIQWGTWVSSTDLPLDVTFPYVFPNFCFTVVHDEYCGSNETTVTTSYFTVNRGDDVSGTPTRHFIAIGI